jgi:hypothetical protein
LENWVLLGIKGKEGASPREEGRDGKVQASNIRRIIEVDMHQSIE